MGAVIALDQSLIPTFVKYRADNIQTLSKSLTSNSDMKQDVLNRLQEVIVFLFFFSFLFLEEYSSSSFYFYSHSHF